jgi:hypothetical protein
MNLRDIKEKFDKKAPKYAVRLLENKIARKIFLADRGDHEKYKKIGIYIAGVSEALAYGLLLTGRPRYGLLAHGLGFHHGIMTYVYNKALDSWEKYEIENGVGSMKKLLLSNDIEFQRKSLNS